MSSSNRDTDSETYPAFRSRPERIALGLVLLVILGLPLAVLGYQRLQATGPVRVIELAGRLPTADHGGWTPETITVQKGERVRLRLASADVVHGFAIPKLGVDAGWIEPGKVKEIEFVADRPGRYTYLCTVWCETGHWRMRGIVQVVDPADPAAAELDVDPPQTDWMAAGVDLDAEHPGEFVPVTPPDPAKGEKLWQQVSQRPAIEAARALDLRSSRPSDIFAVLATDKVPEGEALARLTPAERWDVVAYLWNAFSTPDARRLGAELYQRDCTGCHGPDGRGDGPGAAAIQARQTSEMASGSAGMGDMAMPADEADHGGRAMDKNKPPVDFTDLAAQAGASDLLYYGKLVRGGMGTSMPYWGTVDTEDELWAIIAYLRSLGFHTSEQ